MEKKYTYEEFLKIIETLRSPEGCPWDKVQTHESLKPCVTEEAAELVAAIRIYDKTGNAENMREELGDLLLQVVMHSQIASEEGLFTMEDVVSEVAEKMIRRHPHIFADTVASTSEQVLANWDEIKKKEKESKDWIESPLKEIPKELPSLARAPKILKKIDKLYEKRGDINTCMENLMQDTSGLQKCLSDQQDPLSETGKKELQERMGSILLEISDISRIYKLPLEQILNDKIEDLIDTYENLDKKA